MTYSEYLSLTAPLWEKHRQYASDVTGASWSKLLEVQQQIGTYRQQYWESVVAEIRRLGYNATLRGEAGVMWTGVLSITHGDRVYETVVAEPRREVNEEAAILLFNAGITEPYLSGRVQTPTEQFQQTVDYGSPSPGRLPTTVPVQASQTQEQSPGTGTPAPIGNYTTTSDINPQETSSAAVRDQVLRAAQTWAGTDLLNWDQWNYYYAQVTGLTGPAPEDRGYQRDSQGRVFIGGQDRYPIDVWWQAAFGEPAPKGSQVVSFANLKVWLIVGLGALIVLTLLRR